MINIIQNAIKFDMVQDLFAAILAKGIAKQLKQGLHREYINKQETLTVMRGKLNMPETIRNRIQHKQKLACEFDELSENNLFNQILKTTIHYLIQDDGVKIDRKSALKKLLVFFDGITLLLPSEIQWGRLHYQKNNRNYELLINVCYFVLVESIISYAIDKAFDDDVFKLLNNGKVARK